jgi:hypothetical protein
MGEAVLAAVELKSDVEPTDSVADEPFTHCCGRRSHY